MNKARITRFIGKYNLAGLVESVTWKTDGQKLNTRFIADDKTVLGEITLDNFNFEEAELGIYTTSNLNKMLSVLGDDINLEVQPGEFIILNGASGSGKSFYTQMYGNEYKRIYPKREVYLFSSLDDDSSIDKIKGIKRINIK